MAQTFSSRHPLLDGQRQLGLASMTIPAAAMALHGDPAGPDRQTRACSTETAAITVDFATEFDASQSGAHRAAGLAALPCCSTAAPALPWAWHQHSAPQTWPSGGGPDRPIRKPELSDDKLLELFAGPDSPPREVLTGQWVCGGHLSSTPRQASRCEAWPISRRSSGQGRPPPPVPL